jgi:acetoin utilization deacetylase AcuC-like enzyme
MSALGLITHKDCLLHNFDGHPEHAGRLKAVLEMLDRSSYRQELLRFEAREATPEELARNHDPRYVDNIFSLKVDGQRLLDADTYADQYTSRAATLAFGGGLLAVEMVVSGALDRAFVAVRPPGHHAEYGAAMGFCIFNNVAGAARHAQVACGIDRIAILDFDVHHGNGTQWSFYQDDTVHYTSCHQYPFYPGSGAANERGKGAGDGYTLNIPLNAGTDGDETLKLLEPAWREAMALFKPQLLLISAGFDAHESDPLASLRLTDGDFYRITKLATSVANEHCGGGVVSFLEGGYDLDALARSAEQHLRALVEG